jgi:hypothetical protein
VTDGGTFLDLTVGPYGLALAARTVLGVMQDVPLGATLPVRDTAVPVTDLAALFGLPEREALPFAVAFEAAGRLGAIGVDRVGHLRQSQGTPMTHIPTFGLTRPELIEGGLREGGRFLLVLSPTVLLDLTTRQPRRI